MFSLKDKHCDSKVLLANNLTNFEIDFQFDLVCGNSWYIQMGSTCYLAGMLVGSFTSGILSDRFGHLSYLNL